MKRVGWLKDKVLELENVYGAMEDYNRRRPIYRRRAPDYAKAADILARMKTNYAEVIGVPRKKEIHESGKIRSLEIPSYESCVAQLALWRVCGRYIEKRIHSQSFSSRVGMGGHLAHAKCRRFIRQHAKDDAKYCLYFDIKKFYQHIDKRVVMEQLQTIFKDEDILRMFFAVVYSTEQGLPIGYPFSHALANLYLTPLYYSMFAIGGARYRVSKIFVYMDNWAVFSHYKKTLHRARKFAEIWLERVGCEMKGDWQVFPLCHRYVNICGFRERRGDTKLYRRVWHRLMHNFDMMTAEPEVEHYKLSMMSRLGWLKAINKTYSPCFSTAKGYLW